jgi:hypothetical protein
MQRGQDQVTPRAIGDDGIDRGTLGIGGARADDLEIDCFSAPAARC